MVSRREKIRDLIAKQRKWIAEHGRTRAGYRERYGVKNESYTVIDGNKYENWSGDGGDAIYEADQAELARLEAM